MTNDHPQSKDQQPPAQTAIAERLGDQPKPPADLTFPPLPGIGIDLVTLGRFLVQSGYFTDVKSISQAAVKVLLGQELGVPPITAMMHVYLVQGRPALASGLMAAKIKGSGRYSYKIVRHDEGVCEIRFFERGVGGVWDEIGASVFTADDAERAGLLKKGGAWATYRRNMLFARALSNGARWHTPDLFGGPVYTPEELDERPERPAKPADEPVTPQVGSAVEALANELEKLGPVDVPGNGPEIAATHTPKPEAVTPLPTTVVPLFQDAPPVPAAGDPAKREKR